VTAPPPGVPGGPPAGLPSAGPPLVSASGVSVTYPGRTAPAIRDAAIEVAEGAAIGIVGESGSGKTTLARAVVGALAPTQGQVLVSGVPWAQVVRRHPLRRQVQMIFQDPLGSLSPTRTPRQAVAEVFRYWDGLSRTAASQAAEDLLREVGLGADALDSRPARLSGGQCQRAGIARALACGPRLLVADEPTSALDVSVQAQILNLLHDLRAQRGLALVLVSHDLSVVRHATDHVLIMYDGCVVEEGPTLDVLDHPAHWYTKALTESRPGRGSGRAATLGAGLDSALAEVETPGCRYAQRCPAGQDDCLAAIPPLAPHGGSRVACLHPVQRAAEQEAPPAGDGGHAGL
jgi:oligopeptide/dipeptide ABC transporter ATP-binding protein